MYGEVADAVESLQPGSKERVAAHFAASGWEVAYPQGRDGAAVEGAAMLLAKPSCDSPRADISSQANGADGLANYEDATAELQLPPFEPTVAAAPGSGIDRLLFSARRGMHALGLQPSHLRSGLQMGVSFCVAATLVVVQSVASALNYKSIWVLLTGGWHHFWWPTAVNPSSGDKRQLDCLLQPLNPVHLRTPHTPSIHHHHQPNAPYCFYPCYSHCNV